MNITYVNGTYSKELKEHLEEIRSMVANTSISLTAMKKRILTIIEPAFIVKTAKPRFCGYLRNCGSKTEILDLCNNTIKKATYYYP